MKNNFQSKAVPRGTRTIWRYLSALILLFSLSIGQMWGADLEIPLTNLKLFPLDYGLVKITDTENTTISSNQLQVSKKTAKFKVSTTLAGFYLKSISFTDANPSKNGGFTCDEGSYMSGPTENVYTYTAPNTTTTEANFSLIGSGGTAKMGTIIVTLSTNEQVERLTAFGSVSDSKIPFTSSAATSNVELSVPASNAVSTSSSRISIGSGGKHLIVSTKNSKVLKNIIIPKYQQSTYEITGSSDPAGTYNKTTNVWTPTAATNTSVDLTLTVSSTVYSQEIFVIYSNAASYTITYDANGGDGTMENSTNTVSACTFTAPTGKEFKEWNTLATGLGDSYDPGDAASSDLDLFAIWQTKVEKFTVKYMDGTTELGSEVVEVGQHPTGSAITDPTKDCYTFAGWDPALSTVSGDDGDVVEVNATWTPIYSSSATLISDAVVSDKPNVNTVFAASNIVSSITFTSGNYEFTSNETKKGYYGYKDKASGDYMKILVKQGKRAQVLFGNLGADPTIKVNGVAKSLDAARATGDNVENTFTWTASAEDALISITMGSGTNTLKKVDVIQLYTATRVDGKSDGAGSDANVLETTLPTPAAISGWTFTGWVADQDVKAGAETKTASTILPAGTYTLLANTTFTAQWAEASSTYDITYVSAHGTAPAADNAASVVLAELSETGWAHKGWTANVDVTVDAATVEAGTLIANGKTAILASDVTFTAVWKEIFTVTFDAKGGSAVDPIDVEDGATLAAAPSAPTKDDYVFQGWSETDGGDVVADITAITISADKTFFAKWALDVQVSEIVFSNSFKGWIHDGQVEVFYMAGESAPTIVSYDGKNLKAEGGVVISGDKIIATGTDDSEVEFDLSMTEVTPLATTGAQTFDGSEGYVKTRHAWTAERKWKLSKYGTDGRVARGETSLYIFLGAAESVTLDWGAQKVTDDVAVYVNGTFVKNVGKNNNSAIELSNGNNMVALYSLQTSGDIWLNGLTVAPWVPVTAVALKEGEDPISSKEIWESTSFTLTAEVTPDNASDKTITWTSSNNDVATVVNGVVTGVAANATPVTITASTVDGVNATCVVTVTAAPEPSAAPVITAQPASANYYEGATIAALEVVATGAGTLTYQWYLGADAISGAEAATYTPTVSAIGSYEYHCVVTNTEAGKLPTSLASSNATITIADDPAAIKLFDGEGNLNTTNFISPAKTTIEISEVEYVCLEQFSSNRTSLGGATPSDMVMYNVSTDEARIKMTFYNNNSGVKKAILYKYEEGGTPEKIEIEVPGQTIFTTDYYTFNSSKNRSFYVCMNDRSNIRVLQVKVIDNGANPVKQFGQVGYSLNLNKGRLYAKDAVETTFEGLTLTTSSEYKVYNNSNLATKAANSFTIASPVIMHVERSGGKYYVYQDPEDKGTLYTANADIELNATGTWFLSSETSSSAASFTKIEFLAPKCEQPTITPMSNSDLCEGDDFAPLTVSATVSDEGTLHYAWFKEAGETDEAVGTDAASFTPEADGEYYVIVTNRKDGFSDNSATSNTITVEHFASAVITSAPMNQRAEAGNAVTLTVAATGKNVAYEWFLCDNEAGDNPVAIVPAETNASLNITVTAGMNQWYKVVVSSDCGSDVFATARASEFQPTTPATVTESIVWDWTSSVWPASGTAAFTNEDAPDYELLADADAIVPNAEGFRSDMLYGKGQYVWRYNNQFFQGSAIKFTSTVAGMVRVYFRSTGSGKTVEVAINGTSAGSRTNSFGWSEYVEVPAGEVEMICTGDGYTRIQKIEYLALADRREAAWVAPGELGTVCLKDDAKVLGANVFKVVGCNASGYMVFDQITNGEIEAGKPYLFEATRTGNVSFYKTVGATHTETAESDKGMIGTFDGETLHPGTGNYCYFSGRHIWRVNDFSVDITVPAYCCYVDYDEFKNHPIPTAAPAPGLRRVVLGVNGKDEAQGLEDLDASETPMKVMIDGTLYILRGEKVFDATGRLVK